MNKKLCTALHLIYHLAFGSSMYVAGSGYIEELTKLRDSINSQSTKVIKVVKAAETACKKVKGLGL